MPGHGTCTHHLADPQDLLKSINPPNVLSLGRLSGRKRLAKLTVSHFVTLVDPVAEMSYTITACPPLRSDKRMACFLAA